MSRSLESTSFTTRPSIAMLPELMSSSPASMRSSVDLPQPDGPTRTMNSPSEMSSEMPCRTLVVPKDLWIESKPTVAIRLSSLLHLRFNSPTCEPRHHVPPEGVIDRRRRQRIDQPGGHQKLPG